VTSTGTCCNSCRASKSLVIAVVVVSLSVIAGPVDADIPPRSVAFPMFKVCAWRISRRTWQRSGRTWASTFSFGDQDDEDDNSGEDSNERQSERSFAEFSCVLRVWLGSAACRHYIQCIPRTRGWRYRSRIVRYSEHSEVKLHEYTG